jgi:transcription initiation factor TFIIIB Brf1 subunit/transcription initiation factor TFIIB
MRYRGRNVTTATIYCRTCRVERSFANISHATRKKVERDETGKIMAVVEEILRG